jgi:ribosomal protein S18 acetylase RimI-like enzyme
MTSIQITQITEQYVSEIRTLGLSTVELHVNEGEPEYYSEAALRSFIKSPNDIYLAALAGEILAGYFLVTYNPYLKEAYLIDMVVKPEFRGQGVANRFFHTAIEQLKAKGCTWTWALVHEDNAKMMEIMEKKGFVKGKKFVFFHKQLTR